MKLLTRRLIKIFLSFLIVLTVGSLNINPVFAQAALPPTSGSTGIVEAETVKESLSTFITSVNNGQDRVLTGVYIINVMAFPIVQQPSSNPGFVSTQENTVTQFRMAAQYGTIGLLAHNTLAGSAFSKIQVGAKVVLVYGNGKVSYYKVSRVSSYQALSPLNPYSNFVDLSDPDTTLSATDLFYNIYNHTDQVVFQTCIEDEGNSSWGRLFITAIPYSPMSEYLKGRIVKTVSPL